MPGIVLIGAQWGDEGKGKATDLIGTGRAVGEAIAKKAARDKVEIRVAYRQAEKAGELAAPVQLEGVAAWLNENVSAEGTTPVVSPNTGLLWTVGALGVFLNGSAARWWTSSGQARV